MTPPDLPDFDFADTDAPDRTKHRIAWAIAALWLVAVVAGARAGGVF